MDNTDRIFLSVPKIPLASTGGGSMAFDKQDRDRLEVFRLGWGSHDGSGRVPKAVEEGRGASRGDRQGLPSGWAWSPFEHAGRL